MFERDPNIHTHKHTHTHTHTQYLFEEREASCLCLLGCNHGMGGFNETLVTFWGTKLQGLLWAQKMRLKKCSFVSTIKKLASLFPRLQNAKWRETPTDSTVIENKICPNPNILAYSTRPLNRGKYACRGLLVKYGLGKSTYASKIPPVQAKTK